MQSNKNLDLVLNFSSKDLGERAAIAINTYIPELINDYLEDHQVVNDSIKQTYENDVLRLVVTLKHWANPDSNFQFQLNPAEIINLNDIVRIKHSPKLLLSQDKTITVNDEALILQLLNFKLNQIADELIEEYELEKKMDQSERLNKDEVDQWWLNKSEEDRKRIKSQFEKLPEIQRKQILTKVNSITFIDPIPDPFWYFYFCHNYCYYAYPTNTFSSLLNTTFLLADLSSRHYGGANCSDIKLDNEAVKVLAAVGLFAFIVSGIIGGIYAIQKMVNSVANFCTGNKMLRSAYRLMSIGGVGFGGYLAGCTAGIFFGSVFPGVGTVLGGIFGGILGAGLGAGLGAAFAKYTARFVSEKVYANEVNPTNPEKYQLQTYQKQRIKQLDYDLDTIESMIRAIHRENKKFGFADYFSSKKRAQKHRLKDLLTQIKNYPETLHQGPIKIGKLYYDPFLSRYEPTPKKTSSTANLIHTLGENVIPANDQNVQPILINSQRRFDVAHNQQSCEEESGLNYPKFSLYRR